jgi:hypothetical protein
MNGLSLTHLRAMEAESIDLLPGVAAEYFA